jgi:hypothetical protein
MLNRKPLAPNNRNGSMRAAFLSSLESEGISVKYPKTKNDKPSMQVYARAGRQNSEGFGGGNRVTK